MSERKTGYYWVKTKSGWLIMDWQDHSFLLDGHKYPDRFPNAEIIEINETRIPSPEDNEIDYRDVLRRYISHVEQEEGIKFTPSCDNKPCSDIVFTPAEIKAISSLFS